MADDSGNQRRDRLSTVGDSPLAPDSLVGSYFHSDAARGWQGCVVAEPFPATYLVELFDWMTGSSHDQQLVNLSEMEDWAFYDSADWMNESYRHGVQQRWEREQEQQKSSE